MVDVDGARKAYGQVIALDRVNLAVARGTIHGLVGPNGSGKTTLLNVISGLARVDQGRVRILRRGYDAASPAHRTARLGVGRTFQTPRVFDDLSIWENLQIGADFGRTAVAPTGSSRRSSDVGRRGGARSARICCRTRSAGCWRCCA